ncbi:MAG: TerB family tellurite resistance protein [Pseudomonadota bacterium]
MQSMLNKLKDLLLNTAPVQAVPAIDEKMTVATLLFEAAASDGEVEDTERARIETLLKQHYSLDDMAVKALCENAQAMQRNAIEISRFTREVKQHFVFEERVRVIDMLWDVVYADGRVDDFEANLMRRIGGLIYVDDKANGEARKRAAVRQRLSNG